MEKSNGVSESNGNYTLTDNAYILFNRLNVNNKISFTVKTAGNADRFGISLVREEEGEDGKGFIDGIDGYLFDRPADNTYNVTICTDNSVCVVYINDNVAYTNRIYGIQKNPWSVNSYSGSVEVSNVKVSYY